MEQPSTSRDVEPIEIPKMIIPSEILHRQKCYRCFKYLSLGPIMMDPQNHTVCGRCLASHPDGTDLRKSIYHRVAKGLIFKCSYHFEGCRTMFPYADTLTDDFHENICPFKDRRENLGCHYCSFAADSALELITHVKLEHPNRLIANKFTCVQDEELNAMLVDGNHIFDITVSYSNSIFTVHIIPYFRELTKELRKSTFKISAEKSGFELILTTNGTFSKPVYIEDAGDIISSILRGSSTFDCVVSINQRSATLEEELHEARMVAISLQNSARKYFKLQKGVVKLSQLCIPRCTKCKTTNMERFLCSKGHWLVCDHCGGCAKGCTILNATDDIFNYLIELPCEWNGCKEKLSFHELIFHNGACIFRQYSCPVKNCDFIGNLSSFKAHHLISGIHKNDSVIVSTIVSIDGYDKCFHWVLNMEAMDIIFVQMNPRDNEGRVRDIHLIADSSCVNSLYNITHVNPDQLCTPINMINSSILPKTINFSLSVWGNGNFLKC